MSIINNAHGGSQYAVLSAFYQTVINSPKQQITRDRLMKLCRPENLTQQDNARSKASLELKAWLDLQLFIEQESTISLNCDFFTSEKIPLHQAVRRCLLAPYNNLDLGARDQRAVDLTVLVCLFLTSDVYQQASISSSTIPELVGRYLPGFRINSNETVVVPGYASWLGFFEQINSNAYVIDPTRAIREELPTVFTVGEQLPISKALSYLSQSLPVLDGGSYRNQIEEQLKSNGWVSPPGNQLSTSLSRAFLRLQMSGQIKLEQLSDSADEVSLSGRNGEILRRVTHFTYLATGVA